MGFGAARRDAFKAILPRFPGWYEDLFCLSYKRLPEFERKMKPGGDVPSGAKDHGLPARWPQMGGSMYQVLLHISLETSCAF